MCKSCMAILFPILRQYTPYIAHYHTAGNPGRNEIDDSQEIIIRRSCGPFWKPVTRDIVGQEFVPLRDKVASLSQAVKLCDVLKK